jgi:hypothetical protein
MMMMMPLGENVTGRTMRDISSFLFSCRLILPDDDDEESNLKEKRKSVVLGRKADGCRRRLGSKHKARTDLRTLDNCPCLPG